MFKYQIRGENIAVTDAIREYAERKISKLEKYFDSQDATVHVNAKVYPNKKQKAEVTIPLKGVTLRAEETSDDWYGSLDIVVDKLERQVRKHKTKLHRKIKTKPVATVPYPDENLPFETDGEKDVETDELQIARTKQIEPQAMTPQEAALQMELLGHDFHIFHIQDANSIGLTYRRQDGTIGLLEVALPEHKCWYEPVGEEVW